MACLAPAGGRRERQGGGLRTFPRLLDVPGQQRAQVRSGFVVHSPHGPQLPPRGFVLLLRPGARGVRGRHGLRQGARRQDSHQHAQAQATVHGCGEQRGGDVNEKVGPPRALAEGRAPEVRRRGLSPNARGSGPARQVQARGSRDPSARVRAHRAHLWGEPQPGLGNGAGEGERDPVLCPV